MRSPLAIHGGSPVRTRAFTKWPVSGQEDVEAVARVLAREKWGSGMYFGAEEGSEVRRFEKRFAEYQQSRHGLAVANGTAALEIILRASGILPGDEVIVPDFTFIATATAVLQMGAVPVFADVLPDTFNLDPASVEAVITAQTRAVIGVHWGGQPCDIDRLSEICKKHGLTFIEDACQAHGAEWRGQRVGALGAAGAFSFQGTKNLTCGEGGLIATNDDQLYEMCYSLHTIGRRHGGGPYEHFNAGWNYRLSEVQGALLNEQFGRLDQQTELRELRVRQMLDRLGAHSGFQAQKVDPRISRCSWYLVIFRLDSDAFAGVDRKTVAAAIQAEGVPASAPYTSPIHANPLFQEKNFPWVPGVERLDYSRVDCPASEQLTRSTIFLPQYLFLGTEQDVDDIVTALQKVQHYAGDIRRTAAPELSSAGTR